MGSGASTGINAALAAGSEAEIRQMLTELDGDTRARLAAANTAACHMSAMRQQWDKVLANPERVANTAASKRSPFKFNRANSAGEIDVNIGISSVALPDETSDFGKRYLAAIDSVQDLCKEYLHGACKRQTVPHMSIGSVLLDKDSPQEYNDEVSKRTGLISQVKAELDGANPPIRAKIQTLKINPDGCVTFQLDHDPSQDTNMAEADLDAALEKIPTCKGDAAAGEKKRFKKNDDGTFVVSRFQQVRLALGALGCEIKGMYSSGHMVVVNLVDTKLMEAIPREKQDELWSKCHAAWSPLLGEWFELSQSKCLCYVERSLNEGSVVVAPALGSQPKAFPESNASAQTLLGGIFTANDKGDVLIDLEKFQARASDKGKSTLQSFQGEIREKAENMTGAHNMMGMHSEEQLLACFKVFDSDGSGFISTSELSKVMESLGEKVSDEELAEIVKAADKDGSGSINYKEFAHVMGVQS